MSFQRLRIPLLIAALLAGALVAASLISARGGDDPATQPAAKPSALDGVPQQGNTLGSPDAPVTVVEYADLQCPYCRIWDTQALPALLPMVRAGDVKIEYRGVAFIGPDSETALRFAAGAAGEGKMWQVVTELFAAQGAENSGWVTDDLLDAIASRNGLDGPALRQAGDAASADIAGWASQANADGVQGTPTILVGVSGGTLEPVRFGSEGDLGADGSTIPAVQAALAAAGS